MLTRIFWIDIGPLGPLAIMPRPRGGEWLNEEITAWAANGIDVVVSLLEPDEVQELDLRQEGELCRAAGIEFLSLPIKDRGVPVDSVGVSSLAGGLLARLRQGKSVAHSLPRRHRAFLARRCVHLEAGRVRRGSCAVAHRSGPRPALPRYR